MIEQFGSPHERGATPEYLAALHDTLQAAFADPADPAGSLAVQREQFGSVIAAAHELPLDERAHTLVDHYAAIVEYMWFGGHSDTMPAGLGYFWVDTSRDDDWGDMNLKEEVISREVFDAVTRTLMPMGLGEILRERGSYAEQNQASIEAAYKNLVDSTPGAKWFEAFKVGMPRAEGPLSETECAGREAPVRAAAVRRFGSAPHMPDRPHPAVRHIVDRRLSLLDEATSIRPRPHGHDDMALQGLVRYVSASLAQRRTHSTPIVRQKYDLEGGTLSEFDAADRLVDTYELPDIAWEVAIDTELPVGITHAMDDLSLEFYIDTFRRAYAGLPSHTAVYEAALAESRTLFLDPILNGFNLVRAYQVAEAFSCLKQVANTQPFDEPEPWGTPDQYAPWQRIETVRHNTLEDEERQRRTLVATIEKFNDPTPGTMRLVQQGLLEADLPLAPADGQEADIVLAMRNFKGDPHIPGFKLIAADRLQQRYHFAYQPDADPYRPNDTPIGTTVQQNLADQYDQAQLRALATAVRQSERLTIAELAGLSLQNSTYAYRSPLHPDLGAMLTDIPSFSNFADNDKLRATCDIYSRLGQFSVSEILPSDRVYITGGYTISSADSTISAVAHSQVAIRDDRSTIVSLIDWTAAAENAPSHAYTGRTGSGSVDTLYKIPPATRSKRRVLGPQITLQQQIEISTRQLLMQLGVVFAPGIAEEIPADPIYTKVRALGARHPIAKTLGILLRSADVLQTSDTLPPRYVSEYAGVLATLAALRRRDRTGTTHPQLDMLEAALLPIARFGQGRADS